MSDYWKVVRVIESCKNSRQNNIAYRMIQLYARKYPESRESVNELYDICEENMINICIEGEMT